MLKTLREKFNHAILEILDTSVVFTIAIGVYIVMAIFILLLFDILLFEGREPSIFIIFEEYKWINIAYIIGLIFNIAAIISVMRYSSEDIYKKDAIVAYIVFSLVGYYYVNLFVLGSILSVAAVEAIRNSGIWVKDGIQYLIKEAENHVKEIDK